MQEMGLKTAVTHTVLLQEAVQEESKFFEHTHGRQSRCAASRCATSAQDKQLSEGAGSCLTATHYTLSHRMDTV